MPGPQQVPAVLIGSGVNVLGCQDCGAPVVSSAGGLADLNAARVGVIKETRTTAIFAPLHGPICPGRVRVETEMPREPEIGRRLGPRGLNGSS